jgi:hypothetical protein
MRVTKETKECAQVAVIGEGPVDTISNPGLGLPVRLLAATAIAIFSGQASAQDLNVQGTITGHDVVVNGGALSVNGTSVSALPAGVTTLEATCCRAPTCTLPSVTPTTA